MPFQQQITTMTVAFFILILILELVRKRRLREEYSWLWIATGAGLLMAALWYDGLVVLTGLIGTKSTSSTVFFLGLIFVILLCLQFSVRLSRMTEQVKTLGQRMALLEEEKRCIEERYEALSSQGQASS
jgi:hypothetical protein